MLSKTKFRNVRIEDEMQKSFISYAMAVNVSRAIPDVRDGLKPVHRRILYTMANNLGLFSDKPYRKSVKIVGEVLGNYHPHGDTAVYEAIVRMAQDFSMRYMLVDGQGNFGSVDGDGAAAMRYTEARLAKISNEMLRDIDKETVDFYPNFDETCMQPRVLPARFPALLVNGASGIAVGMATNIPPHNLGEVINGVIAQIKNPEIEIDELMKYVPAPDFPTGGILMGRKGIKDAYRTGKGSYVLRAKTEIEEFDGGARQRIVATEIPYQVNKSNLIKHIAELTKSKKIEGIADLRDESDRDGMRIVIDVKRDANAQVVLNLLFKHTNMQISDGITLLALDKNEPKVMSLKEINSAYIAHQQEVVRRGIEYDLVRTEEKKHIVEGLVIALASIDEVIEVIKKSKDRQDALTGLMTNFILSEKQAQAVLDTRLVRLTSLEVETLKADLKNLEEKIAEFKAI
ncbi:MAG: DNA topoisomerase 4 subunit A, partial [Clostridia bacterium]|nr:DNA topoisomerase 4 subunit A [Clostridia bacterium]